MEKQPLSRTNPFLREPKDRFFWIVTTVTSSTSIEGVHFEKEALEALRGDRSDFRGAFGKSFGSLK
jgi:hypothetical protein